MTSIRIIGALIIGITILIFFLWAGLFMKKSSVTPGSIPSLRVAYPTGESVSNNDPARIDTARQANILRNIYSRLVTVDDGGVLQSHVAKDFRVLGNRVIVEIRDNLETVDGKRITASDVAFSFKRLIVLGRNTHGDLNSFLCGDQRPTKITSPCDGIRVERNHVIFETPNDAKARFLLPLLTGLDFSIVPESSVNIASERLEIIDYRNTSGPYYVEADHGNGVLVLKANPRHFLYSGQMPQVIQLQNLSGDQAVNAYENNEIDMITTVEAMPFKRMVDIASNREDTNLHRTLDIRLLVLQFTQKGRRDFPPEERFAIGARFKKAAASLILENKMQPTNEFFPALGSGRLLPDQAADLEARFETASKTQMSQRKVHIAFAANMGAVYENLVRSAGFEPIATQRLPFSLPLDQQPDAYVGLTDSAFDENISFISYNFAVGSFGLEGDKAQVWLKDYMATEDKAQRIQKLRELHWSFVTQGYSIPVAFSPYTAIIRKPWEMHFPQFFAGTPLWLIRLQ